MRNNEILLKTVLSIIQCHTINCVSKASYLGELDNFLDDVK